MQKKCLTLAVSSALIAMSASAQAAGTYFDNFTPLTASAGPTATPATPVTLSSPNFSQVSLADRSTQNTLVPGSNSGSWDMITANESGPDAGRYLFMPFETGTGGVQRIDLQDNNYATRTVTIVAPGTQSFVSGDASRWTPWGSYLTAEESWGSGSSKGRLFEVTNPTTAVANGGNFVARNVIPRVSHEGLAFDSAKSMYFIDELNGGLIYKYVSANPNAISGDQYFSAGQTFVARVGAGGQFEGNNGPAITGSVAWRSAAPCVAPTIWPSMPKATSTSTRTVTAARIMISDSPGTSTRMATCSTTAKASVAGLRMVPQAPSSPVCTSTSSTRTRPT